MQKRETDLTAQIAYNRQKAAYLQSQIGVINRNYDQFAASP
jgi:hypothetical protein